jgi:hypothetical protein
MDACAADADALGRLGVGFGDFPAHALHSVGQRRLS